MLEVLSQSKSVVFSGHSLGGAVASLSALWLLSYIRATAASASHHSIAILCITYGSPMLGNHSLSQAILHERWGGNFCHVVAPYDLVPRLLSAPLASDHLVALFRSWHLSMITSPYSVQLAFCQLSHGERVQLFANVLARVGARLIPGQDQDQDQEKSCQYWPFGSYMFCTDNGAVCLDNASAIVKFLYLTMAESSPDLNIEDHLKYEDYVTKLCWQYLKKRRVSYSDHDCRETNNEAGIALALQTLGISSHQEPAYATATTCLTTARQLGLPRNLNNAKMAVSLAKINPCRAEIEWYKKFCDDSDDRVGYYDSFKRRGASRREFRVNMNRLKLGCFWDDLITKLETNQLTRDFHKLPKYVNASQSYKLLVEPLEIADYYRMGKHREKGHYIEHGREKRFKIFDTWWGDREFGEEESEPRSKYASLTQDSCFWARVEEAICLIYDVVGERDAGRQSALVEKIERFEEYARGMIEKMEVSIDVLAKNSSYSLFRQEWGEFKAQMQLQSTHSTRFQDGMVQ